jgi:hypothetical protein
MAEQNRYTIAEYTSHRLLISFTLEMMQKEFGPVKSR